MLIVGGGMANTFLLAEGHDIGSSLVESDMIDTATAIRKEAAAIGAALSCHKMVLLPRLYGAYANPSGCIFPMACKRRNEMILDAGHDA